MKTGFKKFLAIYIMILMCLMIAACIYVRISVSKYENTQPEKIVGNVIEELQKASVDGKSVESLKMPEDALSAYDGVKDKEILNKLFFEKVAAVDNWNISSVPGGFGSNITVLEIYGDDELIANVALECKDTKTYMGFLTIYDWEIDGIYPYCFYDTNKLIIDIPRGYKVYADDIEVVEGYKVEKEEKDESTIFILSDLYVLPEVVVKNREGKVCNYRMENNVVTVDTVAYNMILPDSFKVYEGELLVSGTKTDEGTQYFFLSEEDSLTLSDAYGQTISYKNGDTVFANDITVELPSNFDVEFGENDMKNYIIKEEHQKAYEECENYVEMPRLITYELKETIKVPELLVHDNLGNKVEVVFENNIFSVKEQSTQEKIDEKLLEEIDPLDVMTKWVLLNTDNLGKENHGFNLISPYLIKDSVLYTYVYKWTHGQFDINFANRASTHDYPEIIKKEAGNFVYYSENAFSCDVHIISKFYIYSIYSFEYINLNSTCYFVKINGEWKLADYREIINED